MCNCNRNCGNRCCCVQPWLPFPPIPPIPPVPSAVAENIPYPSGFGLQAWNFPPEGAVDDFFVQNDMTLYTTLHINTTAIVSEVLVITNAFAGVIGPVYVGIYNEARQLIATSGNVAPNIQTSAEPVLSRLPLNATTTLAPGKYYVAFSIDLGGGQGFNLLSKLNFMFLLQTEPYSNYFFTSGGPLPAYLPFEENSFYGIAPFIALN